MIYSLKYALLLNVIIVMAFLPFPFVTICGFSNFTFTIRCGVWFSCSSLFDTQAPYLKYHIQKYFDTIRGIFSA